MYAYRRSFVYITWDLVFIDFYGERVVSNGSFHTVLTLIVKK